MDVPLRGFRHNVPRLGEHNLKLPLHLSAVSDPVSAVSAPEMDVSGVFFFAGFKNVRTFASHFGKEATQFSQFCSGSAAECAWQVTESGWPRVGRLLFFIPKILVS